MRGTLSIMVTVWEKLFKITAVTQSKKSIVNVGAFEQLKSPGPNDINGGERSVDWKEAVGDWAEDWGREIPGTSKELREADLTWEMAQAEATRHRCCIEECNHPGLDDRFIPALPAPVVISLHLVTLDGFFFHKFALLICKAHPSHHSLIYFVYLPVRLSELQGYSICTRHSYIYTVQNHLVPSYGWGSWKLLGRVSVTLYLV